MTDSNLFEILGLSPSATLDAVEAKFIETVRARIQEVATSFDEESVKAEEQALRSLHEQFFKYSMVWAAAEMKKPRENPDHADAAKLKKKARTMIEAMQGNIIEFALCYMQINRYGTLLRDEIRAADLVFQGAPIPEQVRGMAGEAEGNIEQPGAVHRDGAAGMCPLRVDVRGQFGLVQNSPGPMARHEKMGDSGDSRPQMFPHAE